MDIQVPIDIVKAIVLALLSFYAGLVYSTKKHRQLERQIGQEFNQPLINKLSESQPVQVLEISLELQKRKEDIDVSMEEVNGKIKSAETQLNAAKQSLIQWWRDVAKELNLPNNTKLNYNQYSKKVEVLTSNND